MSEHGFHVHGPHDHALEHAAHSPQDSLAGQLAVATAILATIGSLFSYMGGATQSNAALYKNDAAIRKTEAANQWAYYQSKSNKQNLAELATELVADPKKAHFQDEARRYQAEKAAIQTKAEKLEAESNAFDTKSDDEIHQHHRWAQATTVLQISIAMAAIALLTRRKWLLYGVYGLGAVGSALGVLAWLHV